MKTGRARALELIQECQEKQEGFLDLGGLGLQKVPEEVFELKHLKSLNLGYFYWKEGEYIETTNKGPFNRIAQISSRIESLEHLEELSLSNNRIEDYSVLQGLANLSALNLSANRIEDISFLQGLTNLSSLDLSNNRIEDISVLQGLTNLSYLYLSSNKFEDISVLQGLSKLSTLYLSYTRIEDISVLQGLTNLSYLYLRNNRIEDYSVLQGLTNLSYLDLSNNRIEDISVLQGLTNLSYLYLSNNRIEDISVLQGMINLSSLDLSSNRIEDISVLQGLTNLSNLDLLDNRIEDISVLQGLTNLSNLNLWNNRIEDISVLQGLTNLSSLDLSSNRIEDISVLHGLTNLSYLDLSNNQIEDISFLQGLTNLSYLYLRNNRIEDISVLQGLTKLNYLNLSNNRIEDISVLHGLTNLSYLNLSGNRIEDYSVLQGLTNLSYLYLRNNQIVVFPNFLLDLPNLTHLELVENVIKDLPYEIMQQSNCLTDARNWFHDLQEYSIRNYEAKLILIGNGRVGKTCIVDRLLGKPYQDGRKSTHAIQIEKWSKELQVEQELAINIWDFGGQDIYHGTHRYFMQSRALFLLVWDWENSQEKYTHAEVTGQEDYTFRNFPLSHWLDYVRSLSKKSPVIIVQNKVDRDKVKSVPNRNALESLYTIQDYCRVSAATRRGITDLEEAILEAYQQMPEIGMKMPLSWYKVREKITAIAETEKDISPERFEKICAEFKVREISRPSLLRYLHNTGIVFYQEKLFQDRIILDQLWAIQAVYTLFDRDQIYFDFLKRGNGKFSLKDLEKIWAEFEVAERKVFLSFMESCEICFKVNDDKENPEYIAPQLLPKEKPYSAKALWKGKETESLHLIYQHQFLHQAFLHRFMVRAGHLADEKELWKLGIVFDYEEDRVLIEVREVDAGLIEIPKEEKSAVIYLQIIGPGRRKLLQRIRNEFKDIHRLEVPPQQWISANGKDFVLFEQMMKNREGNIPEILAISGEKVAVKALEEFIPMKEEELGGKEHPGKEVDLVKGIQNLEKTTRTKVVVGKNAVPIFISYSCEDELYKRAFRKHMKPLEYEGKVQIWDEQAIDLGQDKRATIHANLERAKIIILLISIDFINSKFCWEIQMKEALEKHDRKEAIIIPIIIRECDWEKASFATIQALPKDGTPIKSHPDPDKAWKEVVKLIRETLEKNFTPPSTQ